MTERQRLIDGIAATIQRVYGDATQTHLDRTAAEEIWNYVSTHGMVPLSVVAALIAAAGGEITVPGNVLIDPPTKVSVTDGDFLTDDKIFRAR